MELSVLFSIDAVYCQRFCLKSENYLHLSIDTRHHQLNNIVQALRSWRKLILKKWCAGKQKAVLTNAMHYMRNVSAEVAPSIGIITNSCLNYDVKLNHYLLWFQEMVYLCYTFFINRIGYTYEFYYGTLCPNSLVCFTVL